MGLDPVEIRTVDMVPTLPIDHSFQTNSIIVGNINIRITHPSNGVDILNLRNSEEWITSLDQLRLWAFGPPR